jgi:hypothetical protein
MDLGFHDKERRTIVLKASGSCDGLFYRGREFAGGDRNAK